MNVQIINPFIASTIRVIEFFSKQKATPGKPFLIREEHLDSYDISAIIGLAGDAKGMVVISFPTQVALKLCSKIQNREVVVVDDEVMDKVAEIVNIIADEAKKKIVNVRLDLSLPSLIKGTGHQISWSNEKTPIIGIPFETSFGLFRVTISIEGM